MFISSCNVLSIVSIIFHSCSVSIGYKGELSYKFRDMLEEKTNLKVNLVDERLTTKQATDLLISNDTSRKKRKKVVDTMAATIILQSYLDLMKGRERNGKC